MRTRVQGSTTGNANGTTGSPNGTIGTIGKPMVPLALPLDTNGTIGKITNGTIGKPRTEPYTNIACVHGSTNGTNGIPISFKVLPMVPLVIPLVPMVPLVIPLVPMVPLVKIVGSQYCRQSTVWTKLPTI